MLATKDQQKQFSESASGTRVNGSEALILSLIEEKGDIIFGYPGGAIMPVYDALYKYKDKVNHILVRHEQGAAHAAEGFARMAGKPGVCMATSGPGATNLITGIADAFIDSIPMVCITGQVISNLLGTDAFQEIDILSLSSPVTKWNYLITDPDEIPEIIAKAFYIARTGRPGPVLIDITKDAQVAMMTKEFKYKFHEKVAGYAPKPEINDTAIQQAVKLIDAAKKPLIFAGHGIQIAKGEEQLKAFAEKTGIPVASTLLGLSVFPTAHPLYAGMLGMHGNYGPNFLCNDADLIIAIGMRFDDRVTGNLNGYLKNCKVIHIEIDPAEIHKNVNADVPVHADAKEALERLIPLVKDNQHPEWRDEFHKCYDMECDKVINRDLRDPSDFIKMGHVIHQLSEIAPKDMVMVTDVGQHQMVAARYTKFHTSDSWISSGGLGTMGFALPAAIGAAVATPQRAVVAIIGDGGFQMTIQELGTIMQYQIPVKIIILNNNFLGMVRQWQEMFFENRYSFVEMDNPDFVAIGKGYRIESARVSSRDKLNDALKTAMEFNGPYLLEVKVEKEEKVFPMIPSGEIVQNIRLE